MENSKWSGSFPKPPVGARVQIKLNGWNVENDKHGDGNIKGTILQYEDHAGWVMALIKPDVRPEWHIKEYGATRPNGLFAGCELVLA